MLMLFLLLHKMRKVIHLQLFFLLPHALIYMRKREFHL
jgi:hypothetical protein